MTKQVDCCVFVEPMQAVLGGTDRLKYAQFIKHVRTVAQRTYREEADCATIATLETIRDRIVGDEAKDLASQLLTELKQYLHGRKGENGKFFSLEELVKRVSEKEKIHIPAVVRVLQQAITPGEFVDFKANFSEDYADMFAILNQV